jgi:UDP-N-acetylmuramyl pentapeptide phosphotransferase/UDP-N-acetylglucosamine-1-phosphate transferase
MLFFPCVLILSFLLTWLVRYVAIRKSILDIPNDRSSHTIPTPRGGGIAVAIAWFAGLVYLRVTGMMELPLFLALLSGIPLTLIGFADDIFGMKPSVRFMVQFACAAAAMFFLGGFQRVDFGFYTFNLVWVLTPLAIVAIVWSVNLFNFLDGIDGYISTEVIFIGAAIFVLTGDSTGMLLAVAVLGFLFWNWQKAKIFMGDVGSTLLGFTVAVLAIYHQNAAYSTISVWLILTSVFWFDATLTLFRRYKNKENLSQAHRKHVYQRIVQFGFSHQKTVLYALALNVVGFCFAWLADVFATFSMVFLGVYLGLMYLVIKWVDAKKPFEK